MEADSLTKKIKQTHRDLSETGKPHNHWESERSTMTLQAVATWLELCLKRYSRLQLNVRHKSLNLYHFAHKIRLEFK